MEYKVKNRALVVIDIQNGFMNHSTNHIPEQLNRFINNYGYSFHKIIATQYVNNENTPCYIFEGWKDCMEGSKDAELIDFKHDVVFKKPVYSCYNDEFKKYLKENDINELYMCGVNTGCCVLHSAFDSYNDLVSTYILADLCGSTSGFQPHLNALQVLRECITKQRVIDTTDYIQNYNLKPERID
jgi:nicotinamidase-related amidase